MAADRDHAAHRLSAPSALVGEPHQRGAVVSEQHPVLAGGPLENRRVRRCSQTDILETKEIELRLATEQAGDDPGVEVVVRRQPGHP